MMRYAYSTSIGIQSGLSLVNVMISLVISMTCSLACISLYTNHHLGAQTVREATTVNRQMATSMIALQDDISAAGYGIENAGTNDIVVVTVDATATNAAEVSLLWRYQDDGSVICRGVHEFQATTNNKEYRILRIIESQSDCDITSDLASLGWDTQIGVLGHWELQDGMVAYVAKNSTLFNFQIGTASCAPYGMVQRSNRLRVTITSPNLAQLNGLAVKGNQLRICLINMAGTS